MTSKFLFSNSTNFLPNVRNYSVFNVEGFLNEQCLFVNVKTIIIKFSNKLENDSYYFY